MSSIPRSRNCRLLSLDILHHILLTCSTLSSLQECISKIMEIEDGREAVNQFLSNVEGWITPLLSSVEASKSEELMVLLKILTIVRLPTTAFTCHLEWITDICENTTV